jgi:dihydrofolate reductase
MLVNAILAIDSNNGLAKNGEIPWKSKKDMNFFKMKTNNSIVIMGLKTLLSLEYSLPLTGRENIVITNNVEKYSKLYEDYDSYLKFVSLNDAIELIKTNKRKPIFIIGGKQIYELLMSYCSNIWITKIKKDYDCDLKLEYDLSNYIENKIYSDDELDIYQYCRPGAT